MYRTLHFFTMSAIVLLGAAVVAPLFAIPEPSATPCCGLGGDDHENAAMPPDRFTQGPDGTVRVGNKTCPVMGGEVDPDVGTAFNGWWINFCCPGCDRRLKADPDKFADDFKKATGVDIRKHPAAYIQRPNRHFADGPDGTDTKRLGNPNCPVMGGEVDPEVGTAFNGWWINFCCPGCDRKLKADPDKAAKALLAQTGVDIRKAPSHYESLPDPAFEAGPEGSIRLGNADCPVQGGEVDREVGVVVNGWWVNFCCPGCDRKLKADLDKYAPALWERTGIDIRRSPLHYMRRHARTGDNGSHGDAEDGRDARPHHGHGSDGHGSAGTEDDPHGAPADQAHRESRHFRAGPHGTVALGNTRCPVMDKPVREGRGAEINGWWIGVCCSRCRRKLEPRLDEMAEALKAETGIDIRKTPAEQGITASGDEDE